MGQFIADKPQMINDVVPYYEDSADANVPGRGVKKPVTYYQNQVAQGLTRLGAGGVVFTPGKFEGRPKRYGFLIDFSIVGENGGAIPGRIQCAALPMQTETPRKKDRALAQALYVLAMKLEAMVHSYIYEPDSMPLVPYLIGPGGQTVTEALRQVQALPFPDGALLTDGEIT